MTTDIPKVGLVITKMSEGLRRDLAQSCVGELTVWELGP